MWEAASELGAKDASGCTRSIFFVRRKEDTLLDCWRWDWANEGVAREDAEARRVEVGAREVESRHCSIERGIRCVHCIVAVGVGRGDGAGRVRG